MGRQAANYTRVSYANDLALGIRVVNLEDEKRLKSVFDSRVELGIAFTRNCFAYLNQDSGWVCARMELGALWRTFEPAVEPLLVEKRSQDLSGRMEKQGERQVSNARMAQFTLRYS